MEDISCGADLDQALVRALAEIKAADKKSIEELRIFYLGQKSGLINQYFEQLKRCAPEKKKALGQKVNNFKQEIEHAIDLKKVALAQSAGESLDISLPARPYSLGYMHPVTSAINKFLDIGRGMGFIPQYGPEIEDEFHVFDSLNTPGHHPARSSQDTFYLESGMLLRTHTSSVQIRVMEKFSPPIRILAPGKVYRNDWDATHTPMFHQIEGLCIDRSLNLSHLKFCVDYFLRNFFGEVKIRFRPSFFPFTEPSFEVDICQENGKWLEVMGCGMVHPKVLGNLRLVEDCDRDLYTGFAFGIGVERMLMINKNIQDIRPLFENYTPWLRFYGDVTS